MVDCFAFVKRMFMTEPFNNLQLFFLICRCINQTNGMVLIAVIFPPILQSSGTVVRYFLYYTCIC